MEDVRPLGRATCSLSARRPRRGRGWPVVGVLVLVGRRPSHAYDRDAGLPGYVLAPPANVAAPTVLVVARDGSTLSADVGEWAGSTPVAYSYQWQRCDRSGLIAQTFSTRGRRATSRG